MKIFDFIYPRGFEVWPFEILLIYVYKEIFRNFGESKPNISASI